LPECHRGNAHDCEFAHRSQQEHWPSRAEAFGGADGQIGGGGEAVLPVKHFLSVPDASLTIVCLSGELWLTRHRDAEDHILGAGRSFSVRPGDRVAVQALRTSRIRVTAE